MATSGEPRPAEFDYDILVGGGLEPDKVPVLADTAAELAALGLGELRWVLTARNYGPEDQRQLVRALEDRGVRQRFVLRFDVPFQEMPDLMRAARVALILHSSNVTYQLSIPQRMFEYMSFGVPFVVGDYRDDRRVAGR